VTRIEAVGDTTVLFRLKRPDTFLVDALATIPVVDGDIGTGPFKLRAHTPTTIEGDRNESYYRGRPGLARVQVTAYDRQRTAWAAMMRGDVDMLQEIALESVDFFEGASEIKTLSTIRPYYIPLVFNLRHPILGRLDVRRALTDAVNRDEIVAQAMRGHGMPADDPIWPFHWAYSAAARRFTYNPATAKMRLDTGGFPIQPATPGHMASRFRLTCAFWREGPQLERIALLLQRQFAAIGVDLDLEPLSMQDLIKRMRAGRFDMYLMTLTSGRTFQRTYQFWHSPSSAGATYQDTGYAGVDAILERLRAARTDAEIREGVADLRERFYEDVPAAFLAWPETTRAISTRFHLADPDEKDIFVHIWEWRPDVVRRAER
jgi:ABC-type transport system substrate-binding protein